MEWLKKLYEACLGKDRNITNLAIILIIGIIILIAGGSLFGGKKEEQDSTMSSMQNVNHAASEKNKTNYGEQLEKKLEDILSQIEGVGDVSVMITFHSGKELIPATDSKNGSTITEEKDNQGGSRKVTQSDREEQILVMNGQGGVEQPLILKELQPMVKGVIVAAEGASDIRIKANVKEAVKVALGIPAHKVQVYKKK